MPSHVTDVLLLFNDYHLLHYYGEQNLAFNLHQQPTSVLLGQARDVVGWASAVG